MGIRFLIITTALLFSSAAQGKSVRDCIRDAMLGVHEYWMTRNPVKYIGDMMKELAEKSPGTKFEPARVKDGNSGSMAWALKVIPDDKGSKLAQYAASLKRQHGTGTYILHDAIGMHGYFRPSDNSVNFSRFETQVPTGHSFVLTHETNHVHHWKRLIRGMRDTFLGSVKSLDGRPVTLSIAGKPYASGFSLSELDAFAVQIAHLVAMARKNPELISEIAGWSQVASPIARATADIGDAALHTLSQPDAAVKIALHAVWDPAKNGTVNIAHLSIPLGRADSPHARFYLPVHDAQILQDRRRLIEYGQQRMKAILDRATYLANEWDILENRLSNRTGYASFDHFHHDLKESMSRIRNITRPDGTGRKMTEGNGR